MQPSIQNESNLNGTLPVHVVAQEEVVGLWWEASVFEQSEQVVILTVDIACKQNCSNCIGSGQLNRVSINEVLGANNRILLKLLNCIKRKWIVCVSRAKSQDTFLSSLGIWAKFTDEVSDISLNTNTGKPRYCDKDNCNSNK